VKPSRSSDKSLNNSRKSKDDLDQAADALPEVALTPEERARLLAELEAEFEAAERSIEKEGTISADEFLKRRADYWAGLTPGSGERPARCARVDRQPT
jgi:hypothetical protein